MKSKIVLVMAATICIFTAEISHAKNIRFIKEITKMANNAIKSVGSEAVVESFRKFFNKNEKFAQDMGGPQLQPSHVQGNVRTWEITPLGSLTKADIKEIANTLKALDNNREQTIKVLIDNNVQFVTTMQTNNIVADAVITGNNSSLAKDNAINVNNVHGPVTINISNAARETSNLNKQQLIANNSEPPKIPSDQQPLIKRDGKDVLVHESLAELIPNYDSQKPVYLAYGEPGCAEQLIEGNSWLFRTGINPNKYALDKEGDYFRVKGMVGVQFNIAQLKNNKTGARNVKFAQIHRINALGNYYFNGTDCAMNPRSAIWVQEN